MQPNYIFTSFYFHMLCVTSLSCDLGSSSASGRNIAEYALLLSYVSSGCYFPALQTKEVNEVIKSYSYVFPRISSK